MTLYEIDIIKTLKIMRQLGTYENTSIILQRKQKQVNK